MECPICNEPLLVSYTREQTLNKIKRRRECINKHRFTTTEIIDEIKNKICKPADPAPTPTPHIILEPGSPCPNCGAPLDAQFGCPNCDV